MEHKDKHIPLPLLDKSRKALPSKKQMPAGTETEKARLPVGGMSCAACAASIERKLNSDPNIVAASVNLADESLSVEYVADAINKEDIRDLVRSAGYELHLEQDTADDGEARRVRYLLLKKHAVFSAIISLPVVIIGMFLMHMPYADYLMWLLATPVVLVFGRKFFINAIKSLKHGSANMDTLIALSVASAYLFSVGNVIGSIISGRQENTEVYFEAAAVIITFILLGKMLEEKAKVQTLSSIKKLMELQPDDLVRLKADGTEERIALADVRKGDRVRVRPGDKLPVDGIIAEGMTHIDESMMSGEFLPVEKGAGDKVFAGTLNHGGSIDVEVLEAGPSTLLASIIRRVREAQGSRPPVQRYVDRIAGIFVPVVLTIAFLSFCAWIFSGAQDPFGRAFTAFITVLVIACPCALGLAVPAAITAAIGKAAEKGILVRDAAALETAHKVDAVIFDKTGTLTEGKPAVENILMPSGEKGGYYRSVLFEMEKRSSHPLASAIADSLQGRNPVPVIISGIENLPGKGIAAECDGISYFAGSRKWIEEKGISFTPEEKEFADEAETAGRTLVAFAGESSVLILVSLSDKIRPGSEAAVQELLREGIEVYMLTGDNAKAAAVIAEQAGIRNYHAAMLPHDKAAFIARLKARGKVTAMTGDGINDSEALALSDVGIAMGGGADIAMDVAGITVISSDPGQVPDILKLSRRAMRIIRQNLFWAFIYNLICIPLAAGVLIPVNGWSLNPMIAGAAMSLSSVSVVANSLRLRKRKSRES